MAKFLTSLLNNSDVKQGLEKGPQGISHAAIGLVEQFATRGLIGKVMPGVGMINPLLGIFTEPIVSAIKAQLNVGIQFLFGGGPTQTLNMVDATGTTSDPTGIKQVISNVKGFLPRFEYRVPGSGGFKRGSFSTPYTGAVALPRSTASSAADSKLDIRLAPQRVFAPEKFGELRQVLHTNPMAIGTETHGIFFESSQEKVDNAGDMGSSNVKATGGVFTGKMQPGTTVLGFTAQDTAADATPVIGARAVTNIIDSVFHNALQPQLPRDAALQSKFNYLESNVHREVTSGSKLKDVSTVNRARDPLVENDRRLTGNAELYSGLDTAFTEAGLQGTKSLDSAGRYANLAAVRRYPKGKTTPQTIEELIQQHRFLVFDATVAGGSPLSVFDWEDGQARQSLAAGFSYCDSPSMTIQTEVIKEGTWEFPRQIPVAVEPGRLVLQKGMTRTLTGFYLWIEGFLRGNIARRTLKILAYGRNNRGWSVPNTTRRVYGEWTLYNCAPIRYAAGQGWDARTGEIQIAEMEISYEWFEEATPQDVLNLEGA
jgi:phage tail-like protein